MSQILQLGVLAAETTLPVESRSFVNSGNELNSVDGTASDGTLHTDFIANKRTYTINYGVLSEANKDIITNIYLLQSSGTFLNFIYTNQAGIEVATTVKMDAPSFGSIIPKDVFYYNGAQINLREV